MASSLLQSMDWQAIADRFSLFFRRKGRFFPRSVHVGLSGIICDLCSYISSEKERNLLAPCLSNCMFTIHPPPWPCISCFLGWTLDGQGGSKWHLLRLAWFQDRVVSSILHEMRGIPFFLYVHISSPCLFQARCLLLVPTTKHGCLQSPVQNRRCLHRTPPGLRFLFEPEPLPFRGPLLRSTFSFTGRRFTRDFSSGRRWRGCRRARPRRKRTSWCRRASCGDTVGSRCVSRASGLLLHLAPKLRGRALTCRRRHDVVDDAGALVRIVHTMGGNHPDESARDASRRVRGGGELASRVRSTHVRRCDAWRRKRKRATDRCLWPWDPNDVRGTRVRRFERRTATISTSSSWMENGGTTKAKRSCLIHSETSTTGCSFGDQNPPGEYQTQRFHKYT